MRKIRLQTMLIDSFALPESVFAETDHNLTVHSFLTAVQRTARKKLRRISESFAYDSVLELYERRAEKRT